MRALFAVVVALSSAGCIDAGDVARRLAGDAGPMDWETVVEPAMAPDFGGLGPSYPVLLIHQHHIPSERQKEEARRNPVVCARSDGGPLAFASRGPGLAEDAMACAGPAADPPTGRLYVDRAEFEAMGTQGVAVHLDACGGGAILLRQGNDKFLVRTPAADLLVRLLPDGTFLVDGVRVEPGTALKHSYYLHRGDPMDEEYVRVVFEAPGQWLRSRIAPAGASDVDVIGHPSRGTGLAVDVGLSPPTLRAPIQAAVAASGRHVEGILGLRAVHDGERLTEFTMRLATSHGIITWYGAGRTGDVMRLLGAAEAHSTQEPPVRVDAFLSAFDLSWDALRAGAAGPLVDVRLAPDTAWGTLGATPTPALEPGLVPVGCEGGCVFVREGGAWQRALVPQETRSEGESTLHVIARDAERETTLWWHAPTS